MEKKGNNGDRGNEPFDYVAQMRNMSDVSRKNKLIKIKWFNDYEWLCDEYKNVQAEMHKLCEEKHESDKDADFVRDDRSVGSVPQTTNRLYGWLSAKNDFTLEKYGSFIVKYPNPLKEITLLPGNIPTLAAGKGLI